MFRKGSLNKRLWKAIKEGNTSKTLKALRDGANPDGSYEYGNWQSEPLQWAIIGGYTDIVRLLLDIGADPDGGGSIWNAARRGQSEIVRLLLDAGADPNVDDGEAIRIAYEENNREIRDLLLDHGATDVPGKSIRDIGVLEGVTDYFPDEGETCPICMDDLIEGKSVKTRCKHAYHEDCLLDFKKRGYENNCPLCRGPNAFFGRSKSKHKRRHSKSRHKRRRSKSRHKRRHSKKSR